MLVHDNQRIHDSGEKKMKYDRCVKPFQSIHHNDYLFYNHLNVQSSFQI